MKLLTAESRLAGASREAEVSRVSVRDPHNASTISPFLTYRHGPGGFRLPSEAVTGHTSDSLYSSLALWR